MHFIIHMCIYACVWICICIYFCWFNFDALAQGNAYKPTNEPINYRGPGGDWTHDLQIEATPPAASCPARSLQATEIVSKTQSQWHARCCSGNWQPVWNVQLSISTPVCVNFVLRPGDIHKPISIPILVPVPVPIPVHAHVYIYIYIYIYTCLYICNVNFDALAQASDIQIKRRQVVILCWIQDLNPGSQTPNRQQTECPLTKWLTYRWSN